MSVTKWLQKQEHFEWMQKCLTCWKMCEEFIAWSIQHGKYINLINAGRDATEICSQCIKFEAQGSPFFKHLCEVCAEICEKFALEIEKLESENELISKTLDSCRIFAKECRLVAEKQENVQVKSKSNPAQRQRKKT